MTSEAKRPFDIDSVLDRVRAAVAPLPKAAMFQLAEEGFQSPFEQLVACVVSIRTLDEVMLVCARRLFALARTPGDIAGLEPGAIAQAIHGSTFSEAKVKTIRDMARRVANEFKGELPCDAATILSFKGVGPKCANLALGIACGQSRIGVDSHVHQIVNRWGYVTAPAPEKTMAALEKRLPKKYWVEINRLLVPFGKHVCTPALPKCSACPVLDTCRQVGVRKHR